VWRVSEQTIMSILAFFPRLSWTSPSLDRWEGNRKALQCCELFYSLPVEVLSLDLVCSGFKKMFNKMSGSMILLSSMRPPRQRFWTRAHRQLGLENSLLWGRPVCWGSLAASLAPTHWMPGPRTPSCGKCKCLHTLPNVPWEKNQIILGEKHGASTL